MLSLGFHAVNPSGKIRKIIDKNAADLDNYVAHQLPDTIESMVMGTTFFISMLYVDWHLSLSRLVSGNISGCSAIGDLKKVF